MGEFSASPTWLALTPLQSETAQRHAAQSTVNRWPMQNPSLSKSQLINISIAGLGLCGHGCRPASLASRGQRVWGVDTSTEKVRIINEGRSPIVENGLAEKIARHRPGRLRNCNTGCHIGTRFVPTKL